MKHEKKGKQLITKRTIQIIQGVVSLTTFISFYQPRQANENNKAKKVRFITVMVFNYNHSISMLLIIVV